jgi:NCS2 family nucleobase:cation symporter-2
LILCAVLAQNCGLIPLTRCASRSAGFSACGWLIFLGIFSHFGAAFASIPICVVGGLVLQAWASVFFSGMALATKNFTRRNQFILMIALGIGLGVAMEGHIVDWPKPYTFFRRNLACMPSALTAPSRLVNLVFILYCR